MEQEKPMWNIDERACLHALYEALTTSDSTPVVARKLSAKFRPSNGNPKGITNSTIISGIRRGRVRASLLAVGYVADDIDPLLRRFTNDGQKVRIHKQSSSPPKTRRARPTAPPVKVQKGAEEQKVPTVMADLMPVRLEDGKPPTTLTLSESMCRYPIGHPGDDDFAYCGRGVVRGSYCADHAPFMYQPKQKTRNKKELNAKERDELARLERMNRW